jgi:hypothetical protein
MVPGQITIFFLQLCNILAQFLMQGVIIVWKELKLRDGIKDLSSFLIAFHRHSILAQKLIFNSLIIIGNP